MRDVAESRVPFMKLSHCWLFVALLSIVVGCGGDDLQAAGNQVEFIPTGADASGVSSIQNGESETPLPNDPLDDPIKEPIEDPIEDPIVEDPTPEDPIVEDPEPTEPEPDGWDPEWTDNPDPEVEACLENFPAICNKIDECGDQNPILELLGGGCPLLFDSINPLLTMGCEQIGTALEGLGIDLPIGDLGTLLPKLISGCIDNFQCDPEYLQQFGEAIAGLAGLLGNLGGGGGGGGDLTEALPALLKLAEMCGGLELLLPF